MTLKALDVLVRQRMPCGVIRWTRTSIVQKLLLTISLVSQTERLSRTFFNTFH